MERLLHYVSPLKAFLALIVLTTLIQISLAAPPLDPPAEPGPAPATQAAGNSDGFKEPGFSPKDLFPSWDDGAYRVQGVAGRNEDDVNTAANENSLFLGIVPRIIDLLIQFVAPVVFIMMVYAGIRFISSNDNEEERNKAKSFFFYTVIGLLFILLSYSIMRALYFIYIG